MKVQIVYTRINSSHKWELNPHFFLEKEQAIASIFHTCARGKPIDTEFDAEYAFQFASDNIREFKISQTEVLNKVTHL